MKTIELKPLLLIAGIIFCFGTTSAQEASKEMDTIHVTQLKTIKEYNNYVRTLDWAEVTPEEKISLEEKYNSLIEQMDEQFHHSSPRTQLSSYDVTVPSFTYTEVSTLTSGDLRQTRFLYTNH